MSGPERRSWKSIAAIDVAGRKQIVAVEVAVAERSRMCRDLRRESVRPSVVSRAFLRGKRRAQVEVEHRLACELELATKERRLEGRIDARDRPSLRRRRRRRPRARATFGGPPVSSRQLGREVERPEVLHELIAA